MKLLWNTSKKTHTKDGGHKNKAKQDPEMVGNKRRRSKGMNWQSFWARAHSTLFWRIVLKTESGQGWSIMGTHEFKGRENAQCVIFIINTSQLCLKELRTCDNPLHSINVLNSHTQKKTFQKHYLTWFLKVLKAQFYPAMMCWMLTSMQVQAHWQVVSLLRTSMAWTSTSAKLSFSRGGWGSVSWDTPFGSGTENWHQLSKDACGPCPSSGCSSELPHPGSSPLDVHGLRGGTNLVQEPPGQLWVIRAQ